MGHRRSSLQALLVTGAAGLVLAGCGSPGNQDNAPTPAPATTSSTSAQSSSAVASPDHDVDSPTAAGDLDFQAPNSSTVIVNKQRPLDPQSYAPDDLVPIEGHQLRQPAADALADMLADMRQEGITVNVSSGYRSYDTQVTTYDHWVQQNGQAAADRLSARPGYSEHQTGLAVDLGDGSGCDLQACFANTPAGQWVADNAFEYGFILRFPDGAESVTGYNYEPWHWRYIGVDQALAFETSDAQTMEEYYGTGPAADYS